MNSESKAVANCGTTAHPSYGEWTRWADETLICWSGSVTEEDRNRLAELEQQAEEQRAILKEYDTSV